MTPVFAYTHISIATADGTLGPNEAPKVHATFARTPTTLSSLTNSWRSSTWRSGQPDSSRSQRCRAPGGMFVFDKLVGFGRETPTSESTSLLVRKLLADGFSPVTGNPIDDFNGAAPVPGWKLLCSTGDLRITDGDGNLVYEGFAPDEREWISAIANEHRCLFIGGDGIELDTYPMAGLAAAVWAGRAAGGRYQC
jgi:hypothetical protein